MVPCCSCSVHVVTLLAQPIRQHEAVSTIFISVLIGFRHIRESGSRIHRITCCTYDVLYGGNTILVCMNQMHISGMHLTYWNCKYKITKLPLSLSHNGFWNVFLFTTWHDHFSVWKIVISFINPKCLVMYIYVLVHSAPIRLWFRSTAIWVKCTGKYRRKMRPRIDDIVGKIKKKYISFLPSHDICI